MRPLRLDMSGFTVFRDQTTVDFTDADYFALVGPTGSGKSTVLDAICFVLYGQVPRWGGARGIGNALAPSAAEARVRLVFESAGDRYVATRVVRRDGRGNVKTSGAGLQLMPPGFDVTKLDTGMDLTDLGEVLAGVPAEMDDAVLHAVGLPYEQFTSCVVLPQGQFADFLHAKPAVRQQILINLLGLQMYERVQEKAAERGKTAETKLTMVDQSLAALQDATDEAVEAAAGHLARMRELTGAVEAAMPGLREARAAESAARDARDTLDAELALLASVRTPDNLDEATGAVTAARDAAARAAQAVHEAEEAEEKVRGELAAAGDPGSLRLALDRHTELSRLVEQEGWFAGKVSVAEMECRDARAAADLAESEHTGAQQLLEQARQDYRDAQQRDRAVALRGHLSAGDHCPVCEQPVAVVPEVPRESAVRLAEAAGAAAREAAEQATARWQQRDAVARNLESDLERKRGQYEHHLTRLAEVRKAVQGLPGAEVIEQRLAELARLQGRLEEATGTVRAARDAARAAQIAVRAAEEQQRTAWRRFDTVRDGLARFVPPPADRDDLAGAWQTLVGWARAEHAARAERRAAAETAVLSAHGSTAAAQDAIAALFTAAGVRPPATAPEDAEATLIRAAAVAAERAEAAWQRLVERHKQAREQQERRMTLQRESRVAKSLAGHLRANNFERWLLEEALDLLVDGASRILRELTGGQYELMHDKGEFSVIDHHDAGLRRGVRTLSGGETFQASLALALALSEQLAGMSTTAASLESIVLDEGFGTLDAATLDVVAATLENLAARGDRMVGLVTHVQALAERVPVRFEVHKDARTAHVERVGL
ncbi:chromosome segregation protein SMC [Actinoplanes sp. SE50]|uniref:AAA family ATPase n=1 Tax=unclassified Actinoplanes TaxID=2626549 RepID=UPI00023EBC51|nr:MULTISPECIES: SMC family ATPase [unclassified Actinoplanes]AEV87930.1 Nuclease sbcCD subunit C [Actinoplanes sp. SE50/110]ATO86334.1 chromosome segregation protein SMC [Actinoplanes sp. SE50]SLM03749.1 chromosome segregation protein SMC [Actinoplanes sp. SE50/110]